jgi:hypothetical protein
LAGKGRWIDGHASEQTAELYQKSVQPPTLFSAFPLFPCPRASRREFFAFWERAAEKGVALVDRRIKRIEWLLDLGVGRR